MVPFDRSSRNAVDRPPAPRNYFSRREQFRLMLMVGSLLLVWILMLEARRPENWVWLTAMDEFQGDALRSEDPQPERPHPDRLQVVATDDVANPPRDWDWSVVRDDRPFNAAETDQFLNLLTWWRKLDTQALPDDAVPLVGGLQLTRQSDEYRGKRVRVSGAVRRAHWLTAHPNAQDISGYWRCWLFPDGSDSPIVVYALEMPPAFPRGMAIRESVQFQGVFFKRWAYRAQGGTMTAPLIVARTGQWQPAPPPPPPSLPTITQTVFAVLAVAIFAALLVLWIYRMGRRPSPTALRVRSSMPDKAPVGESPPQQDRRHEDGC